MMGYDGHGMMGGWTHGTHDDDGHGPMMMGMDPWMMGMDPGMMMGMDPMMMTKWAWTNG